MATKTWFVQVTAIFIHRMRLTCNSGCNTGNRTLFSVSKCVFPKVNMKNYKEIVKKLNQKLKT